MKKACPGRVGGRMKTTTNGGDLVSFLARNPYCSHAFLVRLYGERTFPLLVASAGRRLRIVTVKGPGRCYACLEEPLAELVRIGTLERTRHAVLDIMGPDAVLSGLSPGREADQEVPWQNRWWRIWVDPGGCDPEALACFARTVRRGSQVSDVLLSAERERIAGLVAEVKRRGSFPGCTVLHPESGLSQRVDPAVLTRKSKPWKPCGAEQVQTLIRTRRRNRIQDSRLGNLARELDPGDWQLLTAAGQIPLLTRYELAYLGSDRVQAIRQVLDRTKQLEARALIETARSPIAYDQLEERKVLTSRGLALLAAHWGISAEHLCARQPWPLALEGKRARPVYKLDWLGTFGEHYRRVRQAALALLFGARCVLTPKGGVRITIRTTIAGRFLYTPASGKRKQHRAWVQPDAVLTAALYKRGWKEGVCTRAEQPGPHATLLLEIDRGTMSRTRLAEKLDRYREIWPVIPVSCPALVWVIDGSPYRESWLLRAMKTRGLTGWTVLADRLTLPEDHPWWLSHLPVSMGGEGLRTGLPYASYGGLAPWRAVWCGTGTQGQGPLLGARPWRNPDRKQAGVQQVR